MKKIIYPAFVTALISLFAFNLAGDRWKIKEADSVVEFKGGRISGSFSGLKAEISFDKEHPEWAKISASIDAPSIATGFFLKTNHAKDALGVDKYPVIKFISTSVNKDAGTYIAKGNLTLKGVTKPALIHFTFDDNGKEGVFKGSFKVIPKDFGIDRNGTPDEVMVKLTVPVIKS